MLTIVLFLRGTRRTSNCNIPTLAFFVTPARDFNLHRHLGSSVAREAIRGGQVGLLELLTNNGCVLDGLSEKVR